MTPDAVATLLIAGCVLSFGAGWMMRARIAAIDVLDAQIKAERDRRRAMFGEDGLPVAVGGVFRGGPPTCPPPMAPQPPVSRS